MIISRVFIKVGILFLFIALIMYFSTPNEVTRISSETYILSGNFIKHLVATFFMAQIGSILIILGIRDDKKSSIL